LLPAAIAGKLPPAFATLRRVAGPAQGASLIASRFALALFLAAAAFVPAGAEPYETTHKPRLKAEAADKAPVPRLPLADYSLGLQSGTAPSLAPAAPPGLDAHRREPAVPFLGFSLTRPID
jgi:hypothetical protein